MTDWRRPFALKLAQCGFGVDAIRKAIVLAEADVWRHGYHLKDFPIAAADVLPYGADEVRGWRDVQGINKDTIASDGVFRLAKSTDELERAASSFSNLPILKHHPPVRATDGDYVGMLGTVVFASPYLVALDACIYDRAFADLVKSGALPCPSVSYAATTVVEPGAEHDGYQKDIVGRHLTFCKSGRAGLRLPLPLAA